MRKRGPVKGKKQKKKPTKKQQKLIKARLKSPNATLEELATESGYAGKAAVYKALHSTGIQNAIKKDPRFNESRFLDHLHEGLEARKGNSTSSSTLGSPDWSNRHRYFETGLKLRGDLKTEESGSMSPMQIAIFITDERKRRGLPPIEA